MSKYEDGQKMLQMLLREAQEDVDVRGSRGFAKRTDQVARARNGRLQLKFLRIAVPVLQLRAKNSTELLRCLLLCYWELVLHFEWP